MKKGFIERIGRFVRPAFAGAIALAAALTFNSCDAIEKASERDVNVNDFDFAVMTTQGITPTPAGRAAETRAVATGYSGSYTITRADLLSGASFDYDMVKSVKVGSVAVDIREDIGSVTISSLTLSCPGVTAVNIADVSVNDVASSKQTELKAFAAAVFMKVVRDGSATVSLAVTYSPGIENPQVYYDIDLKQIVVRAGLDL